MTLAIGIAGRVEAAIGGSSIERIDQAHWTECVHAGTRLRMRWRPEEGASPEPGARIDLKWEAGTEDTSEGELTLWVRCVRRRTTHEGEWVEIEAADPLGFCAEETQLRSYAGLVSLPALARSVLEFQPGTLPGCTIDGEPAGALAHEWLLQCDEPGAAFLRRVAASVGRVPYWRRDRLAFADIGRSPAGESLRLALGETLSAIDRGIAPGAGLRQLVWAHATARTVQAEAISDAGVAAGGGARGLSRPAPGMVRPPAAAALGHGVLSDWNGSVVLEGANAAWQPGTRVSLPDGGEFVIERVEHSGSGGASTTSYRSVAYAVAADRWAVPTARTEPLARPGTSSALLGPFQAVVADTADPQRLGRLRVTLSEDPERRASHWIPWLTLSAGASTGCHWLPERGELVMVAMPRGCPEAMVALGAFRGQETRADAAWDSPRNAVKALVFRNQLEILVDDQKKLIRLRTPGAELTLDGEGQVQLNGRGLQASLDGKVDLKAGGTMSLDGSRIDLG